MPTLTIPNTFTSGTVINPSLYNDNIYDPNDPNNSLEIINGNLDSVNINEPITSEKILPGSLTIGQMVGDVRIHRYYQELFYNENEDTNNTAKSFTYITNCGSTFYLSQTMLCIFSWGIYLPITEKDDNHTTGRIFFEVDGTGIPSTIRWMPNIVYSTAGNFRDWHKCRYHTGSYIKSLNEGWHNAGLKICIQPTTNNSTATNRIEARIRHFIMIGIK